MKNHDEDSKSAFNYTDKILKFCNITVTVIMVILTGHLFLLSIFGTSMITGQEISAYKYETTVYLTDSPLFHIAAIVLVFLVGYLLSVRLHTHKKQRTNHFLIALHIGMAIIMIVAIFTYRYHPIWDQGYAWHAAYELINGDYGNWKFAGFNYIYPQLNFLTLFWVPFVYIFGLEGSLVVIRIVNLVFWVLSSYFFYGFCKETKLNGVISSVLFILYFPLGLYTFFIYGNIISLSCSLLAIWMAVRYLNHNNKKDAILSAVAAAVSILFKDTGLIIMIAILMVFCIYGIIYRQWGKILWIPIFIAIYLLGTMTVNMLIEGITGEEVPSGMGYYGHLTMGISEGSRANGWYNEFTLNALDICNYDYDLYNSVTKEALKLRAETLLDNPAYVVDFFSKKTASQWNNPTFQSIWIMQWMLYMNTNANIECTPSSLFIDGAFSNMIFYYIFNLIQSLVLFGSLCYFVFEARKASLSTLIPAIAFIGGFLLLFFWEAKAQYTVLFFVMLFPYAVAGFLSLAKGVAELADPVRRKQWYQSGKVIFLEILLVLILVLAFLDISPLNVIFKPGNDNDYYNEYIEQNVYIYSEFYGLNLSN